jgi:hypothetical protein
LDNSTVQLVNIGYARNTALCPMRSALLA